MEDVGAIPVLDELAEAALHQLVAQDGVGQQRVLRRGETRHVLRRQAVVRGRMIRVGKDAQKSIHALGRSTTQGFVSYLNHGFIPIYIYIFFPPAYAFRRGISAGTGRDIRGRGRGYLRTRAGISPSKRMQRYKKSRFA